MDLEMLRERAKIIREVRAFFDGKDYLETDTPLLSPDLIPESCLEVFETLRLPPEGSRAEPKPYWLIPSPEIWMKRLLAKHKTNMYQVCKCFRNGESSGRQHSPEFTMLEYYTVEADYLHSLRLTEELAAALLTPERKKNCSLSVPFEKITVEEAFKRWAGFDLYAAASVPGAMEKEARRLGLNVLSGLSVPELYDLVFVHAVEPKLKEEGTVALMDYPAFVSCLAKKSKDGKTLERWELYSRGIEIANCFTEETRAEEVRRFFEREYAAKEKSALVHHRINPNYWEMFNLSGNGGQTETSAPKDAPLYARKKFPPCSGTALGLDRLIMVLNNRSTIDSVLPFPMESTTPPQARTEGSTGYVVSSKEIVFGI